jgi:hypothetical protein
MTMSRLIGAAAVLSALIAVPVSAQATIDEPGMFAFFHPNGDLGIGSSRPPADAQAMAPPLVMRHALPTRRVHLRK